jgi:hypothetical protein
MYIPIIGLLGRSRVGKDTAATFIINKLGKDSTHVARLSQPLKTAAMSLYNFSASQVEEAEKEVVDSRYASTPRECIQALCTHIMKMHGADFFSRQLFGRFDDGQFHGKCLIIPDIRFNHDINEVHKRGGLVIKVVRPFNPDVPNHGWESAIDQFRGDHEVQNNGDLNQFLEAINQILCNTGLASPCLTH